MPDVYARKGETITCEKGHPICDMAETVHFGDEMHNIDNQLENWRQKKPKRGDVPIPVCEICGSAFHAAAGNFHFEDGWR